MPIYLNKIVLLKLKFYFLILFLALGCDNKYTIPTGPNNEIEETNYETDINYLENIILLNNLPIFDPLELGEQTWENNRLTKLIIQNNSSVSVLPESIHQLDSLNTLILDNNSIVHLPGNLCLLELDFNNPNNFSINGNYLCPSDVPYCIEGLLNFENQTCDWDSIDMMVLQEIINLNGLNLSINEFGAIQTWEFGRLTSLVLSGNDGYGYIQELPTNIYLLNKLQYLDLNNHLIYSLPESFGYLENLEYLNLSSNRLSILPESIGELSYLSYINLFDNRLSYLPTDFSDLSSCFNLDLSYNLFSEFPTEILDLYNLNELNLSINYITSIPEEISQLNYLNWLDLHYNEIFYVPNAITDLNQLIYLDLGYNNLEDFSMNIGLNGYLETLYLDNNNIQFITPEICNSDLEFSNSYFFMIENNNLCIDSVPECIANDLILGFQNCMSLNSQNKIHH